MPHEKTTADHFQDAFKRFLYLTRADLQVYLAWLEKGPATTPAALIAATGLAQATVYASRRQLLNLATAGGLYLPGELAQPVEDFRIPEFQNPEPTTVLTDSLKPTDLDSSSRYGTARAQQTTLIDAENEDNCRALDISPQELQQVDLSNCQALGIDPGRKQNKAYAPPEARQHTPAEILWADRAGGGEVAANLATWRAAHDDGIDVTSKGKWNPALIWVKILELQPPPIAPSGPPPTIGNVVAAAGKALDHVEPTSWWQEAQEADRVREQLEELEAQVTDGPAIQSPPSPPPPAPELAPLPEPDSPATPPIPAAPATPTKLPRDDQAHEVWERILVRLPGQGLNSAECLEKLGQVYGHALDSERLAVAAPDYAISWIRSRQRFFDQAAEAAGYSIKILVVEELVLCQ